MEKWQWAASDLWSYTTTTAGIVDDTAVTAKAAAGGANRIYVTGIQIVNAHATVATVVQILDGAAGTALFTFHAGAAGGGVSLESSILRGSPNTLLEIKCGTTGSQTYVNLQGYVDDQ